MRRSTATKISGFTPRVCCRFRLTEATSTIIPTDVSKSAGILSCEARQAQRHLARPNKGPKICSIETYLFCRNGVPSLTSVILIEIYQKCFREIRQNLLHKMREQNQNFIYIGAICIVKIHFTSDRSETINLFCNWQEFQNNCQNHKILFNQYNNQRNISTQVLNMRQLLQEKLTSNIMFLQSDEPTTFSKGSYHIDSFNNTLSKERSIGSREINFKYGAKAINALSTGISRMQRDQIGTVKNQKGKQFSPSSNMQDYSGNVCQSLELLKSQNKGSLSRSKHQSRNIERGVSQGDTDKFMKTSTQMTLGSSFYGGEQSRFKNKLSRFRQLQRDSPKSNLQQNSMFTQQQQSIQLIVGDSIQDHSRNNPDNASSQLQQQSMNQDVLKTEIQIDLWIIIMNCLPIIDYRIIYTKSKKDEPDPDYSSSSSYPAAMNWAYQACLGNRAHLSALSQVYQALVNDRVLNLQERNNQ